MESVYMFFLGTVSAVIVVTLIKTLEPGHPKLELTQKVAFAAAFIFMFSLLLGVLKIFQEDQIFKTLIFTAAFLLAIWVLEVFSPTPLWKSSISRKPGPFKEDTEPGKRERIV